MAGLLSYAAVRLTDKQKEQIQILRGMYEDMDYPKNVAVKLAYRDVLKKKHAAIHPWQISAIHPFFTRTDNILRRGDVIEYLVENKAQYEWEEYPGIEKEIAYGVVLDTDDKGVWLWWDGRPYDYIKEYVEKGEDINPWDIQYVEMKSIEPPMCSECGRRIRRGDGYCAVCGIWTRPPLLEPCFARRDLKLHSRALEVLNRKKMEGRTAIHPWKIKRPLLTFFVAAGKPGRRSAVDFSWTKKDEIVVFNNMFDDPCMIGIDTRKGTTEVKVVEEEMSREDYIRKIYDSHKKAGLGVPMHEAEEEAIELLRIAATFPVGSIVRTEWGPTKEELYFVELRNRKYYASLSFEQRFEQSKDFVVSRLMNIVDWIEDKTRGMFPPKKGMMGAPEQEGPTTYERIVMDTMAADPRATQGTMIEFEKYPFKYLTELFGRGDFERLNELAEGFAELRRQWLLYALDMEPRLDRDEREYYRQNQHLYFDYWLGARNFVMEEKDNRYWKDPVSRQIWLFSVGMAVPQYLSRCIEETEGLGLFEIDLEESPEELFERLCREW